MPQLLSHMMRIETTRCTEIVSCKSDVQQYYANFKSHKREILG